MSFENMGRSELVALLEEVLARTKRTHQEQQGSLDEQMQLVHELRVYQIELEMQNRELRDAQRELEQSRDRYAELYDFAPVAYFTLNDQFVIEGLNFRAAALLGQPRELLLGRSFVRVANPRDPSALVSLMVRARETAMGSSGGLVLNIGGEARDVQAIVSSSIDPLTHLHEFRCALIDVSDRVRAEAERDRAHAAERTLHQRFETLDRINLTISNILATSERTSIEAVLGALAEHALVLLTAQRASISVQGDVPRVVTRERGEPNAAKAAIELVVPLRLANRSLGQLTVECSETNSTSLADAQRTLELLAERAALALEIARLNSTEADERARLTVLDRAAREFAGCTDLPTTEAALAAILPDLVPEFASAAAVFVRDESTHRLVAAVHPDRDAERQITRAAAPLAERLWALVDDDLRTVIRPVHELSLDAQLLARTGIECVSVVPLVARKQALGFLSLGYTRELSRDALRAREVVEQIADRCAYALDAAKLLEQLRTAVQSRDTLLAIVSHDLRSPLNAILLTARSLASAPPQTERRRSGVQVDLIQRSVARMGSLIEDLLTASTIDNGQLRIDAAAQSTAELVREACLLNEPSAAANQLTIVPAMPAELPDVWADRSRILQVLTNLLANAIKFSPPNSVLRVQVESHGEEVRFAVIDSGPGIAPQQLKQVFERYWTGKSRRQGLGLGLFISERLVAAHGGRIWVESTPGNGAAFYFTLPAAPARAHAAHAPLAAAPREAASRRRAN